MIEKMKNTQGLLQRTRAIKIVLVCHGQGVSWSYETGDSAECSETFQQAVPLSRGPCDTASRLSLWQTEKKRTFFEQLQDLQVANSNSNHLHLQNFV